MVPQLLLLNKGVIFPHLRLTIYYFLIAHKPITQYICKALFYADNTFNTMFIICIICNNYLNYIVIYNKG